MKLIQAVVLGFTLMVAWSAYASAPQNQVPSCYAANPKVGQKAPTPSKWLYVVLDQTVVLDANLKQSLADIIKKNIEPGMGFTVLSFSAFSQGKYLDHVATGIIETTIDKKLRNDISVKALESFDKCMQGQFGYGLKLVLGSVGQVLQQSNSELQKSDVFASLAESSRLVKDNNSAKKVVLVVSDMLENSTVSSFYSNNNVRKIDPEREIKNVESNGLLSDFGGADIYVMGAGMLQEPQGGVTASKKDVRYRDPKTMAALKKFWEMYFSRSNGKLEEFGMPALLSTIRW